MNALTTTATDCEFTLIDQEQDALPNDFDRQRFGMPEQRNSALSKSVSVRELLRSERTRANPNNTMSKTRRNKTGAVAMLFVWSLRQGWSGLSTLGCDDNSLIPIKTPAAASAAAKPIF